jgi:hypothetical protein
MFETNKQRRAAAWRILARAHRERFEKYPGGPCIGLCATLAGCGLPSDATRQHVEAEIYSALRNSEHSGHPSFLFNYGDTPEQACEDRIAWCELMALVSADGR